MSLPTSQALKGIRVIDFSLVVAGPFCSLLLSSLGAEVIHIHSTFKDDMNRVGSPARYNAVSLNRLEIAIDLKKPEGVEIAKRLVKTGDIVVENRAGLLEKLGLGYAVLKAVKPDIIMISGSGFGGTGPESSYAGFATNFVAASGLSSIIGYEGDLPNEERGPGDFRAGQYMALAVMVALFHHKRTGEGQHMDLSMTEVQSCGIGDVILDYTMNGRIAGPQGNNDAYMAPHNCYRCKGEDKWISIAVGSDDEWRKFCQAIGQPEWTKDARFANTLSRFNNREELDKKVTLWTIDHEHYEVMKILQAAGVASMPSKNSAEIFTDKQYKDRKFIGEVVYNGEKQLVLGAPFIISKTPADIYHPSPRWGENTDYICQNILSMSDEQIKKLKDEKVIK
jgi:benzylsuccinate CoA-transferase BbsF subunit